MARFMHITCNLSQGYGINDKVKEGQYQENNVIFTLPFKERAQSGKGMPSDPSEGEDQ